MNSFQQYLEMARNEELYISNEGFNNELKDGLISLGIIGSLLLAVIPIMKGVKDSKVKSMIEDPQKYALFLEKNKKGKTKEELKKAIEIKIDKINKVKAMKEGPEKEKALEKIREEIKKEFKEADRFHSNYMIRNRRNRRKR